MPIKRRERDSEEAKIFRMEHLQADHELFLQAFEKPTQIYRYLRTRNVISPIFLHRNLFYMKERMSRKHKTRKSFKVDSLLSTVTNKQRLEAEKNGCPNNFMTIMFLGFYNKAINEEQFVEVEVIISQISHMKRKDSFKAKNERVGAARVKINPVDMIGKIPALSIPTELFKQFGGSSLTRTCLVQMNVTLLPNYTKKEEPILMEKTAVTTYEAELVVFDKHNRCTLGDGEYELTLHMKQGSAAKTYSPKKHPTWEVIPESCLDEFDKADHPLDDFNKHPTLKFRLSWTKDKWAEMADRPLPITIRKEDHFISNKENEPDQNHNSSIIENGIGHNNSLNSSIAHATSTPNIPRNYISNSNSTMAIVKLHDIASRIIYHFIYNNNSSQQTETCDNFNCPWCGLHCLTLYSLLKHLKLCHARFNFTYVPTPNGVRVDVSVNEQFDGSYTGSPHDLVGPAGSAFARAGPVRRTTVTRILVCRPRRQKPSLTEFLEIDENELNSQRPYITGHNRLYHHTLTCLPIHPKGLDIDSEGENDPAWLRQKTLQMIDEFTDVNEGEKELMKMWNLHIMRNGYVGDIQIPLACDMFIDMRGKELLKKNLYRNFVLHMCNLFDYGLVSPEVLYKTIQKLQRMLSSFEDGRQIISEAREKQEEYWLNVGIHKQREQQLKQQLQEEQHKENKQKNEKTPQQMYTTHKRKSSQISITSTSTTTISSAQGISKEKSTIKIQSKTVETEHIRNEKIKRDAKTRLDFNDQKLMVAVVPVLKKLSAKEMVKKSERRQSTILPAKEGSKRDALANSGPIKRKSTHARGESPPRRRSLGTVTIHQTRRNSIVSSNFLRKGRRQPFSMSKVSKLGK